MVCMHAQFMAARCVRSGGFLDPNACLGGIGTRILVTPRWPLEWHRMTAQCSVADVWTAHSLRAWYTLGGEGVSRCCGGAGLLSSAANFQLESLSVNGSTLV